MTSKTYRSAQGRVIDLGAIQLKNEHVRAVGNMNVNARGDVVDTNNKPIQSRNSQVNRQYQKQTTNVTHNKINVPPPKNKAVPPVNVPPPPEDFDDNFVKEDLPTPIAKPAEAAKTDGIAAAMARARAIKSD